MFFGNHTIFPPSPPEKIAIYLRMSAAGIYVLHPHQLPYNVDSWAKILLFRTHHLWNSTTELIFTHIVSYMPNSYKKSWTVSNADVVRHAFNSKDWDVHLLKSLNRLYRKVQVLFTLSFSAEYKIGKYVHICVDNWFGSLAMVT